ncbi:ATP-NAD kinase [Alteromonas sediminis]|uniref:ATP-NAD kinase n=1 Tax=Alteromonas sediminis TaxID=2259342 RepID=A0A3N5XXE3_9ALTE|nr:ATP-NAD kinase family protein [Alteromonas sediminis]RPJ65103.1 ATP-NAD kinase [Alteromonas sediminis]
MSVRRFKLGLIVNPYAGIGGALALKGSDGQEIRQKALLAGAKKLANEKTGRALKQLLADKASIDIYTASAEMGETIAKSMGFETHCVYYQANPQTEPQDTVNAARALVEQQIDLLLFAGGDGTARNIFDEVGLSTPVIGVPAGCKIHSGVYAVTPGAAGEVVQKMVRGEIVSEVVGEVKDIDEHAFRDGVVRAQYYGEMRVPHALMYVQSVKMGGKESDELVLDDIIAEVESEMEEYPDHYFVMGSGSTVAALMASLALPNTLLGVDVVFQGQRVLTDATAEQLEALVAQYPNKIKGVITLIGGQGHVFGRGNQQLSPAFIRAVGKQNFYVLASKSKLETLNGRPLRVDTGDEDLDAALQGPLSIITGYKDRVLYPIA